MCTGGVAVMRQFVGQMSEGTVRDLLLGVSPEPLRETVEDSPAHQPRSRAAQPGGKSRGVGRARRGWVPGCVRDGSPRPMCAPTCSGAPCSTSCIEATSAGRECPASGPRACWTGMSWPRPPSRISTRCPGPAGPVPDPPPRARGATLLLLDEPTDDLHLASAEAIEDGLHALEGTVMAVTHDRWFTRGFDGFWVLGGDGAVVEAPNRSSPTGDAAHLPSTLRFGTSGAGRPGCQTSRWAGVGAIWQAGDRVGNLGGRCGSAQPESRSNER